MKHTFARPVLGAVAVAVLSACASTTPTAVHTSPSAAAMSCTSSGPASNLWPAPATRSTSTPPIVSAAASQNTFTLTFDSGTPGFEVTTQAGTRFYGDTGLGQPIDVAGSAGVKIVLTGFRGDMANYTGPASLDSQGPLLVQVKSLGGSEGQVSWAAGLTGPGCASVTAAGSTLTFRFISQP